MIKKIKKYFSPEQVISRRLHWLKMYCAKHNFQVAYGLINQMAREWDAEIKKRQGGE